MYNVHPRGKKIWEENALYIIKNGNRPVHKSDSALPPVSYTHLDVYKRQLQYSLVTKFY